MKKYLFYLAGLASIPLTGQDLVLDTAVVSASHFQTNLREANRNVIVLKGDEISQAPVNTVAELLDFAAGIDARQRGIFGTQTDLSIRGGSFEQVLVLLNGVRLSDPQTGHHLMNLPVQKSDIERIEILMGGGSYIFGGTAFSGAVNIITKEASSNQTEIDLSAGSFGSISLGLGQRLTGENHQSSISLSHSRSAGFKENTDFSHNNLAAQSRITLGEQKLNLSGGYSWQQFGAQSFYSDNFPDQFEKTRTLFVNAGMQSGEKLQLNRQLYWRRNWDEFQLFREGDDYYQYQNGYYVMANDTAPGWYGGHNYHRSDVMGAKLEAKFSSRAGKTALSADYRYEGIISNNLGDSLAAPIDVNNSRGSYYLGQQRHNVSLAAEQSKKFGALSLSGALLINYNTAYQSGFYPALTAGYLFSRQHKVYGSINRSFRLPSYTDLYYRLGGAVGSKDLKPENSLNYEIGYKHLGENSFFNLSLFRREGSDIIDWIQQCDTCELRASNTTEVNFNGLEASYRWQNAPWLKSLKFDFIELGYSHLFTDKEEFDYQSLYVFDYLKNKLCLRAQQGLFTNFKLSYSISYQDRNGRYRSAETGVSAEYEDVLLINARASYRFKVAELYLAAQNLLDTPYYDRGNVQLPGLWLWTGLSLKL